MNQPPAWGGYSSHKLSNPPPLQQQQQQKAKDDPQEKIKQQLAQAKLALGAGSPANKSANKSTRWGAKVTSPAPVANAATWAQKATTRQAGSISFSMQSRKPVPTSHHFVPASSSSSTPQKPATSSATPRTPQHAKYAPSPKHQKAPPGVWPESLVLYVERSLAECGSDKAAAEAYLKKRIEDAVARDALNDIDWAAEPLAYIALADSRKRKKKSRFDRSEDARFSTTPTGKGKKKAVKKQKRGIASMGFDDNEYSKRNGRAHRFQDTLPNGDDGGLGNSSMFLKMQERAYGSQMGKVGSILQHTPDIDFDSLSVVGTCQTLEKKYLRLTSAPDPAKVRPLKVLKRTLDMLKGKWAANPDYKYTCEQFKSMRQDLTIQHHRNLFTVEVYETHALWALTMGDLSEYNQCQTQLMQLYEKPSHRKNYFEFCAYRLLYYVVTSNQTAMTNMLKQLTPETRADATFLYAMKVRAAVLADNFHQFFQLCHNAPFQTKCLTSKLIPHMRFRSLNIVVKAYRPTKFPLTSLQTMLEFDSLESCRAFLVSRGGALTPDGKSIDTKSSSIHRPIVEEVEDNKIKDVASGVTHGAFMYT